MEELHPLAAGRPAESVFLLSWPTHSSQMTRRGGSAIHGHSLRTATRLPLTPGT
jgi:hypothetical protein